MTTHHFSPSHYYTTLGTFEPVLKVASGDTIVTTCVDARGMDETGNTVTPRGNPMTGPFAVSGAEPGDMLEVRLLRVQPNRRFGWSSSRLASNVVDPDFVRELPVNPDGSYPGAEWDVDVAAGIATLIKPETKLGRWVLPLRPMLGCFGVAAPEGQSISTATSAEHGGNMDYNGFGAGVTAFFPVFAPGALFFLGDAHATQGDGEMTGTGIEISCEAEFSLHLHKKSPIRWPRGHNATHIFTLGNARPLDQAAQHATTEMARWLTQEYGLDPTGAQILMGQAVEYELGNMYDPAYTFVCKVAKRWLTTTATA